LWAFNEESVARAIAGSKIPVISCVGHETDFTIADFVADLRAPTPSAAAELVSRAKAEVAGQLGQLMRRLVQSLRHRVANQEIHLGHLVRGRLAPVLERRLELLGQRFENLLASPVFRYPLRRADEAAQELDELSTSLALAIRRRLERAESDFHGTVEKLHLLSPLAVLGRGYAIAFKLPGRAVVKDAASVAVGDRLELKLHRGELKADVIQIRRSGGDKDLFGG
jgi:exodeoxyribonuclease VII large subunit